MAASPSLPDASPSTRPQAMRHLLAGARLRESLALQRPASVRNAAVAGTQAALAASLVAGGLHLSAWPAMAGFGALGALAALFGRFAAPAQRRGVVAVTGVLLVAAVSLLSAVALAGVPAVGRLLALAAVAGVLASLAHRTQVGPPGAVIFVFAASAAIGPIDGAATLWQRMAATALGAVAAWLLCTLTDGWRSAATVPATVAAPVADPARSAAPLSPGYVPRDALRVAVCAALAALLAHAAGWSHPAWAAIGAIAVLQGAHLHGTMHRAWQRTIGTALGACIAWALLSASPSFWGILLAVAVLQFITELVIGFNYALGQIAVTPMALLMTALSAPAGATTMAVSRVADTALGAVVSIALAVAFSTLDERVRLAHHHGGTAR